IHNCLGTETVTATGSPEPGAPCELSPVNASHPVQALMESFTALSGCASRGTAGLPQEVHVLNLRAADQGPGQPQREDCSLNWATLGLLSRELSRLFTFPAHPPPPYWKECF
ncbi:hypothetical protein FD754_002210, partial [Muntiacus muntjak]